MTDEMEVSQRGSPQSTSLSPIIWLTSPLGLWKRPGWATLSPHIPCPVPSMPLMILKQRVVNQ